MHQSTELDMAQNLPFSIANILRADFPDPSRISKLPQIVHEQRHRENRGTLSETRNQSLRGIHFSCDEERFFGGNNERSPYVDGLENCIKFPQSDFVGIEGQEQSSLNGERKGHGTKKSKAQNSPRGRKTLGRKSSTMRRTNFSLMQVMYLKDTFSRQHYLTRNERRVLADALELKEIQIRNWFQNRRYLLRRSEVNQTKQVTARVGQR